MFFYVLTFQTFLLFPSLNNICVQQVCHWLSFLSLFLKFSSLQEYSQVVFKRCSELASWLKATFSVSSCHSGKKISKHTATKDRVTLKPRPSDWGSIFWYIFSDLSTVLSLHVYCLKKELIIFYGKLLNHCFSRGKCLFHYLLVWNCSQTQGRF